MLATTGTILDYISYSGILCMLHLSRHVTQFSRGSFAPIRPSSSIEYHNYIA